MLIIIILTQNVAKWNIVNASAMNDNLILNDFKIFRLLFKSFLDTYVYLYQTINEKLYNLQQIIELLNCWNIAIFNEFFSKHISFSKFE